MKLLGALTVGMGCLWAACVAYDPAAIAQTGSGATVSEVTVADNVIVVPDKNARSVTGWLIVRAGCADEAEGQCVGIAHYLEHLLFINRDSDNRSKVALFPDGAGNGWTTHRSTVYFQRFPAQPASNAANLDKLVGFFAGLLADVRADAPQAERERNVVLQEYQQNTGRNPFARFNIELNRALLPDEPLGQRVIGSPETIRAFTTEAARAFHDKWYARNNAVLVLHGPIDPAGVAELVERYIAPLPVKPIPPNIWKTPQRYEGGSRLLRAAEKDARQVVVYLEKVVTFEAPEAEHRRLDAASAILSSFLSSRLRESPLEVLMEEDGLVAEARMSMFRIRDGAIRLSFSAIPATGIAPEKVVDAARRYVETLARSGLAQETVARLKLRITNERALLAEQPALYAQALVSWLSAHYDHKSWQDRQAEHDGVTVADVNRLLQLVAGQGREVTGIMVPDGPSSNPTTASSRRTQPSVLSPIGAQQSSQP